jgi:hypothetical protein
MFDLNSTTMTGIKSRRHLLIHISHRCKCYKRDHGVTPLRCTTLVVLLFGVIIRCTSQLWRRKRSLRTTGYLSRSPWRYWAGTCFSTRTLESNSCLQGMKQGTQFQTEENIHFMTQEQCVTHWYCFYKLESNTRLWYTFTVLLSEHENENKIMISTLHETVLG